jgi:hypothetical protein
MQPLSFSVQWGASTRRFFGWLPEKGEMRLLMGSDSSEMRLNYLYYLLCIHF